MSAEVASACSGKHRRERGSERDLWRLATKMMKMASMQGLRRGVAGRIGRGRRGDARGHVGEARGWLWPWWQRTAATGALGEVGINEGESRGRVKGFERFGTTLGHSPTRPEARRQAGGVVVPRARVRCPASAYWQRLGMTSTRPVGWAVHWAGQVSSLSL